MFVLPRKAGEPIIIGDADITITVVEIRSDYVRIGIDAPKDLLNAMRQSQKKRAPASTSESPSNPLTQIRDTTRRRQRP